MAATTAAAATAMATKVGILSIGDMGMGIANLLVAHGFCVATTGKGRSSDTIDRARRASVEILPTDEDLARSCAVVLSVVPPRDAAATAMRIVDALSASSAEKKKREDSPLYLVDLNAVAPSTIKAIAEDVRMSRAPIRFVDGCIIGSPPRLLPSDDNEGDEKGKGKWDLPSMPTSGPHSLAEMTTTTTTTTGSGFGLDGPALMKVLNMRHITSEVGAASGLKMSFASFNKGLTAIAIQSYTTAAKLGVLDELKDEMRRTLPHHHAIAEKSVVGMAPKAYRWVREMEEIGKTFGEEGGFTSSEGGDEGSSGKKNKMTMDMFSGAAGTYRTVAEDTALGKEKIGKRKRGLDVEDMARAMAEGMEGKKKKND